LVIGNQAVLHFAHNGGHSLISSDVVVVIGQFGSA